MDTNSLPQKDILVLGGGPCGGTVALGLRRLGYAVTLVTETRSKPVIEVFTNKIIDQMRAAGFCCALRQLSETCDSQRFWNGQLRFHSAGLCHLNELDQGIILDLQSAGVHVIAGRAGKITAYGSGYQVEVVCGDKQLLIPTSFMVEARGRLAPMADQKRIRGDETLSLQYFWHDKSHPPQIAFESFNDGYICLTARQDGSRFAQLTVSPKGKGFRDKQGLEAYCQKRLLALRCASSLISRIPENAVVSAQASTAFVCEDPVSANWIRVGDAAIAFDPVTDSALGHSLACAMAAPAVINTLIRQPEQAAVACQYYQELLKQKFYTANRLNTEIYAEEQRWNSSEFWLQRHYSTGERLYAEGGLNQIRMKNGPYISGNYVVKGEGSSPKDELVFPVKQRVA